MVPGNVQPGSARLRREKIYPTTITYRVSDQRFRSVSKSLRPSAASLRCSHNFRICCGTWDNSETPSKPRAFSPGLPTTERVSHNRASLIRRVLIVARTPEAGTCKPLRYCYALPRRVRYGREARRRDTALFCDTVLVNKSRR